MSNKYIDAILSENYGAIDQKKAESAGLGLIIGAAAVVGIPFYLMASETAQRQGSFSKERLHAFSSAMKGKELPFYPVIEIVEDQGLIHMISYHGIDRGIRTFTPSEWDEYQQVAIDPYPGSRVEAYQGRTYLRTPNDNLATPKNTTKGSDILNKDGSIRISGSDTKRKGSRLFGWFKERDKRREEAQKRSMETMMQGRNRMSDASQAQKDASFRRMMAAL